MFYLDLSEVESAFGFPWILSFSRKNYYGDRDRPLDECIRELVHARTGKCPDGPIRMLTQVSLFGFCFNPVSFYYCWDRSGESVRFVVAEITNTPWGERHAYVLESDPEDRGVDRVFDKQFHVSPFLPMKQTYRWRFTEPRESLGVHMENREPSEGPDAPPVFDATLVLKRTPLGFGGGLKVLLRLPLAGFQALILIYYQALKLFLKGVPFHPHPSKGGSP